jgi:hypothetical protein
MFQKNKINTFVAAEFRNHDFQFQASTIRFLGLSWIFSLQFRFVLLIYCTLLYQVLMATWRNGRPPVRWGDSVHVVLPYHDLVLSPFEGQPRKYATPRRLPRCEVRESGIPKAGNGLWLAERVRKGQTITLFRRKRISEAAAKKLHKKVQKDFITMTLFYAIDSMIRRGIGTFAPIMQLAFAWIRNR